MHINFLTLTALLAVSQIQAAPIVVPADINTVVATSQNALHHADARQLPFGSSEADIRREKIRKQVEEGSRREMQKIRDEYALHRSFIPTTKGRKKNSRKSVVKRTVETATATPAAAPVVVLKKKPSDGNEDFLPKFPKEWFIKNGKPYFRWTRPIPKKKAAQGFAGPSQTTAKPSVVVAKATKAGETASSTSSPSTTPEVKKASAENTKSRLDHRGVEKDSEPTKFKFDSKASFGDELARYAKFKAMEAGGNIVPPATATQQPAALDKKPEVGQPQAPKEGIQQYNPSWPNPNPHKHIDTIRNRLADRLAAFKNHPYVEDWDPSGPIPSPGKKTPVREKPKEDKDLKPFVKAEETFNGPNFGRIFQKAKWLHEQRVKQEALEKALKEQKEKEMADKKLYELYAHRAQGGNNKPNEQQQQQHQQQQPQQSNNGLPEELEKERQRAAEKHRVFPSVQDLMKEKIPA